MPETIEPPSERDELLANIRRLEAELDRYREHAKRTSKLFLSVTDYAEWVRERARRDAELALRKARARVDRLTVAARELEHTEQELARQKDELARLQALTDETRARLSAFLSAGLHSLNADVEAGRADGPEPSDLGETLQSQLSAASVPAPEGLAGETPGR